MRLINIIPRDRFGPAVEKWEINTEITARVTKEEGVSSVIFSSVTGDITDQVYNALKTKRYFKDLELIESSSYVMKLPIAHLETLLNDVAVMDIRNFTEGKRY